MLMMIRTEAVLIRWINSNFYTHCGRKRESKENCTYDFFRV